MTLGYWPTLAVDGPPPLPPEYGLLQAAAADASGVRFVNDADDLGRDRWLNGVIVYPYPPDTATAWDACAPGTFFLDKPFGATLAQPSFAAITVVLAETCTSYKVWNQTEFSDRAKTALGAVEGAAVEQEFMSGHVFRDQPYLADGSGTFPNLNAATRPNNAVQLLEQEIAKSGKLGIIHCTPMMATALLGSGFALSDKTGVIRTINGNVVIPGFGYVTGATNPTGHPAAGANQEWVYATGAIDIRRSELFITPDDVSEALERGTGGASNGRPNSITYRAERYYVVDWDTEVQAAVLADRCSTTC